MALPNKLNQNAVPGSTLASDIDQKFKDLYIALQDIFGVPDNTNISAAALELVAAGLKTVILQDAAADPAAAGQLRRNVNILKLHEGNVVVPLAYGGKPGSINQTSKNNATTPNTQYDLQADRVTLWRPSDNSIYVRDASTPITNNISTAGPAANGRDQAGAFSAGSWVHFYWIYGSGQSLATISSTVAPPTGPTLPTNYTHWTYACPIRLDGSSNLIKSRVMGDIVEFEGAQNINNGSSVLTSESSAVSVASVCPPNALTFFLRGNIRLTTTAGGADGITAWIRYISGVNFVRLQLQCPAASQALHNHFSAWIPNVNAQFYHIYTGGVFVSSVLLTSDVLAYKIPNGG